tara:strand:+ start:1357 stop:1560 length:204 start_codon:yes stop_codon:yes gene_type:complete
MFDESVVCKSRRDEMSSLNPRINSYQQTGVFKVMKMIAEGIVAIGEGMEMQHDENLLIKKKAPKKVP